jgi:hypothetical protein
MNNKIQEIYKKQKENVSKDVILNYIKNRAFQKSVDIIYDKNSKLIVNNKFYPLKVRLVNSALNNILFIPTKLEKLSIYNLKFNLVNIVDLDTKQNPNQYIVF